MASSIHFYFENLCGDFDNRNAYVFNLAHEIGFNSNDKYNKRNDNI